MRVARFFGSVGLVALLALVSGGKPARAEEAALATPEVVSHEGRIEGDFVLWQSSFRDNVSTNRSAARERIALARPFKGEIDGMQSPGLEAVVNGDGAIVALDVFAQRLPDWGEAVTVRVRAPLVHDGRDVVLLPPLARSEAVQRIEVTGDGELRFEPERSTGLVHNVGSWSTPGVHEEARHRANAYLGGREPALDQSPLYVVATSPALEHGLKGRALTAAERARPGLLLAVLTFLVLGGGSIAAYRVLGREVRVEQAEAFLREEFEKQET